MKYFNPAKLMTGTLDVESIFEASDSLGYEIIRVVGVKSGAHYTGVGGFDIPRSVVNATGIGAQHVLTHGIVYMYPDANMQKHGFVLATEKNKRALVGHLTAPVLNILNQKDKAEIVALAEEMGKPTERGGYVPANIPESNTTKKNTVAVESKSKKLEEAQEAEALAKAENAKLKLDLENSELEMKLRASKVAVAEEAKEVAEDKLEVSNKNDITKATILDIEEKVLGDDGEIKVVHNKVPKPAMAKRIIKKK